ncbi:MAG: Cyclic nucleotide-gated potassium channel [Pelotomaculum sp. PtaB.Bin104]|nr:MAG: Cyclic nucleotide-gated potassium channel [Pelotomaculum sp. PtaB.Bin104]
MMFRNNEGKLTLNKLKRRVFEIITLAAPDDKSSKFFETIILSLIALSITAVILETVNSLHEKYAFYFNVLEIITVSVFSVEYVLRLWTCTFLDKYKNPITGRLRFAFTPMLIIDLMSILPFFIPMIISVDTRFLRALRLLRLFRILKTGRYFESLQIMNRVINNKKEELLVSLSIILILLIMISSCMYWVENSAQPEVFSSIPATMWWGIATLTTVGYGDMYPITPLGKLMGGVVTILGLMLFALPTGIFASGFTEEIQYKKSKRKKENPCSHHDKMHDQEF